MSGTRTTRLSICTLVVWLFAASVAWAQPEVITYTRPDGGVSVLVPAPACLADLQRPPGPLVAGYCPPLGLTRAQALEWVRQKDVPATASNVRLVDQATLPPREEVDAQGDPRPVRDAWRLAAGQIQIDRTVLGPSWRTLVQRLRLVMPETDRTRFAAWLDAVERAARAQDAAQLRALLGSLRTDAQRPAPAVLAEIERTFQVKGVAP